MKTISRHSTKYDGSLHYRYPLTVVREDPDLYTLYGQPGTVCDSYRGQLTARYHSLELYWSDRFYNLTVMWHLDWRPRPSIAHVYLANVLATLPQRPKLPQRLPASP